MVAAARRACCQTRAASADDRRLVAGQRDLGQLELVGADPVAGLVLEERVDAADLDRDAEGAQVLLVALEHLLERLVARVGVEDLPDPVLGDVVALDEQHDEQVEQPLGLRRSPLPDPPGCVEPAARMSTTK